MRWIIILVFLTWGRDVNAEPRLRLGVGASLSSWFNLGFDFRVGAQLTDNIAIVSDNNLSLINMAGGDFALAVGHEINSSLYKLGSTNLHLEVSATRSFAFAFGPTFVFSKTCIRRADLGCDSLDGNLHLSAGAGFRLLGRPFRLVDGRHQGWQFGFGLDITSAITDRPIQERRSCLLCETVIEQKNGPSPTLLGLVSYEFY